MSPFGLSSVVLITVTMVVVSHATDTGNTDFDDRPSNDNRHNMLVKRDIDNDTEDGFFFTLAHFFERRKKIIDNDKPDFITTFDIIRLFDEEYAMKQFFCVINEEPCDEVGMRLKASIPEEINRHCERCTSTEKNNIRRILNYVKKHYPKFWNRVEPIYIQNTTTYNEIINNDINNVTVLHKI